MSNTHHHLSDEQLAGIAAGDGALEKSSQEHLAACAACRDEVAQIRLGLARFSELARQYAPTSRRRVVIAEQRTAHHYRPWAWGAGLATATAMAAAVIMVLWLGQTSTKLPIDHEAFITQQQLADGSLLKDVDELVEDPLPRVAAELSENGVVFGTDEEFLDFIVPPVLDGAHGIQEEWTV